MHWKPNRTEERLQGMKTPWLWALIVGSAVVVGLPGCGGYEEWEGSSLPEDGLGESEQALSMIDDRLLGAPPNFTVCWEDNDYPVERQHVRDALLDSWANPNHSSVTLSGWGGCGSGNGDIPVWTKASGRSKAVFRWTWGDPSGGPYTDFDHIDLVIGQEPFNRYTAVAIHEFGHALGFNHEHNRSDATCNAEAGESWGPDTLLTPLDNESIMSATGYCHRNRGLSFWDTDGLRRSYGFPDAVQKNNDWCTKGAGSELHVGDFDGDGMDDLFCLGDTGRFWIDYADKGGGFNGTDWTLNPSWCTKGSGSSLYIGDFNGDGRDDLFCHGDNGKFWFRHATYRGEFPYQSYSYNANWCKNWDSHMFIGDFDGDSRDDLLCHSDGGTHWIDYASNGFTGTDWSVDRSWCTRDAGSKMYVGEFTGDGADDLLCLGDNGKIWIDYAYNGKLWGTNWSREAAWCKKSYSELYIGDYNGDGRDDLMCHHTTDGYKYIDFVEPGKYFEGIDWQGPFRRWCNGSSNDVLIGHFDQDDQADMLCHSPGGTLYFQYPTPFVDTTQDSRYPWPLGDVGSTGAFMSLSLEHVVNEGSHGATLGRGTMLQFGPYYTDQGQFEATMRVWAGDPDLYVRIGAQPTTSAFDCRPYLGGQSTESCTLSVPDGAAIYVAVRGYSSTLSDFSLRTAYPPVH